MPKKKPTYANGTECTILGLPGGEVQGVVVNSQPLQIKVKLKLTKFTYDGELPPDLDTLEFRTALACWLNYKGSKAYKPEGLRGLIAQANKRAIAYGVEAVINAMEAARGNLWAGWNHEGLFEGKGKTNGKADPRGNMATLNSFLNGLGSDDDQG